MFSIAGANSAYIHVRTTVDISVYIALLLFYYSIDKYSTVTTPQRKAVNRSHPVVDLLNFCFGLEFPIFKSIFSDDESFTE
jgi:hypothetical protein